MKLSKILTHKTITLLTVFIAIAVGAVYFNHESIIAPKSLNDPNATYGLRFYTRGSDCGAYINDQLVYDSYGKGFGSLRSDFIENINEHLQEGDNKIALKIESLGSDFDPGDDYECFISVFGGKDRDSSKRVAYLNLKYAGQNHFTMGETLEDETVSIFKETPTLEINDENPEARTATISGIINIQNLKK